MTAPVPAERFRWQVFDTGAALAETLALEAAATLGNAVQRRGKALIAVSGGTTPKPFFQRLSGAALPWENVVVLPCDERFVEPASPRSNEKLIRDNLLQGAAAVAGFVPLFHPAPGAADAAVVASIAISALPLPLDLAVLGMGLDGHTASFFPDADLGPAFDPNNPSPAVAITAASAGEARITLTLPVLARAKRLVLHIEGDAKREAFERAMGGEPALPIRTAIERAEAPVEVFWAP